MHTLHVKEKSQLLDYLFQHLAAQYKKTKIRQILKFGSVSVNGHIVTLHRHELNPGDVIQILSKKGATVARLETRLKFKLIYEDADLVVVEKPVGLLTMGTESEKEKTLYFMLTEYVRTKSSDGRGRVFIVHRIDQDTSGFLVFAKNAAAKEKLQAHWKKAVKKYYAITEGTPKKRTGVIQSDLAEDSFKRVYSTREGTEESRHAITRYEVIRSKGRYALLEITLETGRKNQIRVHLAEIGHPVVGDLKYGATADPMERLALHACYLSIPHPATGKTLTFGPELPESFQRFLDEA